MVAQHHLHGRYNVVCFVGVEAGEVKLVKREDEEDKAGKPDYDEIEQGFAFV